MATKSHKTKADKPRPAAKAVGRGKGSKARRRDKGAKAQRREPLLFISHKHDNYKLADVLREWVELSTGGTVKVFQSSSEQGVAPRVGLDLKEDLKSALWHAGAFVMIYTYAKLDWSYCTFEYGVANTPNSPDTRMVLLQCCDPAPPLFAGRTTVNLRDLTDVKKFVKQFLTDPKFFPDYGGPVSKHAPGGPMVTKLAEKLHKDLNSPEIMPPRTASADEEWPAYPFLQLQLDMKHVQDVKAAAAAARLEIVCRLMREECKVSATDKELARIFGFAPGLATEMKFGEFLRAWEERDDKSDARSKWIESLGSQIMKAAQWQFPPLVWELMRGLNGEWFAPMLTRVRRVADAHMEFDVYFFKFDVDEKLKSVRVGIPEGA